MKTLPTLALCALAQMGLVQTALADGAVPLKKADCTFAGESDPGIPERHITLSNAAQPVGTYEWKQDDLAPAQAVDGQRNAANGLVSFTAALADGMNAFLSIAPSGDAELTLHGIDKDNYVIWTTQIGKCEVQ